MKSYYQIMQEETEATKEYTFKEHKKNIYIYSVIKFLFSDFFAFFYIFIPLIFIAYYFDFKIKVILALLVSHPFIYFFIDRPLYVLFKHDELYKEAQMLIDVNKELIKQKFTQLEK